MKKLLTILLVAFLGGSLNAQQAPQKAKVESAEKFAAGKKKGKFEFQLPATATKATVDQTASYYVKHFTVSFDESAKKAKVTMVQNDAESRLIILRFLVANDISHVTMDGKDYDVETFYADYIK